MLITFEGIDGSGKSTQAYDLDFYLEASGYDVEIFHEPGSTAISEQIRSMLLHPEAVINARAELGLFLSARAQLVGESIKPALEAGRIVICDRYYDSTTAYQGGGRGVADYNTLNMFNQFFADGLVPDRTYFIDVPVRLAFERRSGRSSDRIESSGLQFYERVREAYLHLVELEPERVKRIEGDRPIRAIHQEIRDDVKELLESKVGIAKSGTGRPPSGSPTEAS